MLSLSGDDESSGALAGVQAALDEINSRDDLLPGYPLNFTPIIDKKVKKTKQNKTHTTFPTCPVYQNVKFPYISYTYQAEDREEFHENKLNV